MLRRIIAVVPVCVLLLAACSPSGRLENPFTKKPPFVPTPVPADFAIVVDENHDTFYARQHIQQVITAADAMSRTSYATYRDYSDSVARRFSQETPLNPQQLQAMWNDVSRSELMIGATTWVNWRSDADMYRRNVYTVQIRANGMTQTFRETNGFSRQVRPLMVHIQAVRLPIGQNVQTQVIGQPGSPTRPPVPSAPSAGGTAGGEAPATGPAGPTLEVVPENAPATAPTPQP